PKGARTAAFRRAVLRPGAVENRCGPPGPRHPENLPLPRLSPVSSMDKYSYLSNVNSAWLDDLYRQYQEDPASVETSWARFFEGFDFARSLHEGGEVAAPAPGGGGHERFQKEFRVVELINGYRARGHFFTHTNPVRERRK